MVEIFSPWRADIASAVVLKWPCVWRPYNLLCTMFTLTSFRTNKFVFTVLSYWSYLIAEGDYGILLMMPSWETERDVVIKPFYSIGWGISQLWSPSLLSGSEAAALHPLWRCTFEFKGGKQILIAHRSGPTIRFWRGVLDPMLCCLSGNNHGFAVKRSSEVNAAWKASFHTQIWQLMASLFFFFFFW